MEQEKPLSKRPAPAPWWFRLVLVAAGLAAWFGTQALIGAQVKAGVAVRMAVLYELLVGPQLMAVAA